MPQQLAALLTVIGFIGIDNLLIVCQQAPNSWESCTRLVETFGKRLFLPPALFINAHLLLNKLRFAA